MCWKVHETPSPPGPQIQLLLPPGLYLPSTVNIRAITSTITIHVLKLSSGVNTSQWVPIYGVLNGLAK